MDLGLDKTLNREHGFAYPAMRPAHQVRLLRCVPGRQGRPRTYQLIVVSLADLRSLRYRALSYAWGRAQSRGQVQKIVVNEQPFFIRRNLADFLSTAATKNKYGLFFVDAICVNQLDDEERRCQVKEMARVFRLANEVVAWLGAPPPAQVASLQKLRLAKGQDRAAWTDVQWEAFHYLSHHPYWSRLWAVQEILLAPHVVLWCGPFTFSLSMLSSSRRGVTSAPARHDADGRPSSLGGRVAGQYSPAQTIITHRLCQTMQSSFDALAQGASVGTLEEITQNLARPPNRPAVYQSRMPEPLHHVLATFGQLSCSDPRDKLYGILGLLREETRANIEVDYTKDVGFAFYQALSAGLDEIFRERVPVTPQKAPTEPDGAYLQYYYVVRDSFEMDYGDSVGMLRRFVREFREQKWGTGIVDARWHYAEMGMLRDFRALLEDPELEKFGDAGKLYKYHAGQRRRAESW